MTYKVAVIRTVDANDWKACFTGDGDGQHPGGGCSHVGYTQAEAEAKMRQAWGEELAPSCTEEHLIRSGIAYRCSRTDCPIEYQKPADA